MKFAHNAVSAIDRLAFSFRLNQARRQFLHSNSDCHETLLGILEHVRSGTISRPERKWWDAIEAERHALYNDSTILQYDDHGAGKPRLFSRKKSATTVSRSVAELGRSSSPPHEGRLIFSMIRSTKPTTCVELGTCLGISAAYTLAALSLNENGELYSIEGGAAVAAKARETLTNLGLPAQGVIHGVFDEQLQKLLPELGTVDFVYVDGHHEGPALTNYVDLLLPYLTSGSILVVDDILWSAGMRRAWKRIRNYDRVSCSVDLLTFGVCLMK